ncbi:MAG: HEAT repeat domain-containing protein [Candidatus Wallbacteria bacterium]|nr:HEAT repeat domain-containing protein [Candidatus Wallbacteria bacterium]
MLNLLRQQLDSHDAHLRKQALHTLFEEPSVPLSIKKMIFREISASTADMELGLLAHRFFELLETASDPDLFLCSAETFRKFQDDDDILTSDSLSARITFLIDIAEGRRTISRIKLIRHLVRERDPRVIACMIDCFKCVGRREDASGLLRYLKHTDPSVRISTVNSLKALGHEGSYNRLVIMLQDSDSGVAASAESFVHSLNEPDMRDLLRKMVFSSKEYNLNGALFLLYRLNTPWSRILYQKAVRRKKALHDESYIDSGLINMIDLSDVPTEKLQLN